MEFYHKSKLVKLKSLSQLYSLLQISPNELRQIIAYPEYESFRIPKKSGGYRSIDAPVPKLKVIQSKLNDFLSDYYYTIKPDCVHGFIRKTSVKATWNTKSNAAAHVGKDYVLNMDLQDFFHSIEALYVQSMFTSGMFQCNDALATALALICCYKRKLPMGSPTSPVISNMYCYEMDIRLQTYCKLVDITYTRYADDLTFSSNNEISETDIKYIREVIFMQNLTVNESKCRIQSKFGKQWVTGLKVNEKVNVDRKYKRIIRAILYDMKKNGVEAAARRHYGISPDYTIPDNVLKGFVASLEGMKGYVNYINK